PDAVLEGVLVERLGRDGDVLPEAGEVHEPQVDGLDLLLPEQGQHFARGHGVLAGAQGGWWGGGEEGRRPADDSVIAERKPRDGRPWALISPRGSGRAARARFAGPVPCPPRYNRVSAHVPARHV